MINSLTKPFITPLFFQSSLPILGSLSPTISHNVFDLDRNLNFNSPILPLTTLTNDFTLYNNIPNFGSNYSTFSITQSPSFSIFQSISSNNSILFAAKKKKKRVVTIRLESEAGTGYFYTTTKNRTRHTHKLAFMKYDPMVDQHVLFTESKGAGRNRGKSRQKKGR